MAKQTTGEQVASAVIYDVLLWVMSLWTAFLVMVLWGAVVPKITHLPTLGYWTAYLGVMLLTTLGSVASRGLVFVVANLKNRT